MVDRYVPRVPKLSIYDDGVDYAPVTQRTVVVFEIVEEPVRTGILGPNGYELMRLPEPKRFGFHPPKS